MAFCFHGLLQKRGVIDYYYRILLMLIIIIATLTAVHTTIIIACIFVCVLQVTLNVCLGDVFTGGQLFFKGVRYIIDCI